jgi:hypothetical protein
MKPQLTDRQFARIGWGLVWVLLQIRRWYLQDGSRGDGSRTCQRSAWPNITVNPVAPGPVGTDLFIKGKSDAPIDQLKKMSPLEQLGLPKDIANVVSFLAGPEGGWINSQVLRANVCCA